MIKVGTTVRCNVETRPSGYKYILSRPKSSDALEERNFLIIRVHQPYEDAPPIYTLLVADDDIVAWNISRFHVDHHNIGKCFENKRFWEVSEEYIVGKAK